VVVFDTRGASTSLLEVTFASTLHGGSFSIRVLLHGIVSVVTPLPLLVPVFNLILPIVSLSAISNIENRRVRGQKVLTFVICRFCHYLSLMNAMWCVGAERERERARHLFSLVARETIQYYIMKIMHDIIESH
jgi:hypothetical protein